MPVEVTLDHIPAGYSLNTALEGEEVTLIVRELVSSEDEQFKSRMDGIPRILVSFLSQEQIGELIPFKAMVAIVREDATATLYLDKIPDDLEITAQFTSKRDVDVEALVYLDDIADIKSLKYKGITFPTDAGIVVYFRAGLNFGFFYDMSPLQGDKKPRDFDVEKTLGSFYCYVSQQHLFNISDEDWQFLLENQWFPFITLKVNTRREMAERARARLSIDDLLPAIVEQLTSSGEELRQRIKAHSIFANHSNLLEHALDRYLAGDYVSATAILFPRIEGIMRSIHQMSGITQQPTQRVLAAATVEARDRTEHPVVLLLPDKFQKYLDDVYFANFNTNVVAPVSRNSVGHGVAEQSKYNRKAATIALLIIDQISFLLPDEQASPDAASS